MKRKLIAIDDDPVILELIKNALPYEKYEIITASSADEALPLFLEQPTSVVLSDLMMPGMSGEIFIEKIKDLGFLPLFIVLTSVTDAMKVVELFKQGVHDYILKPFLPGELENRIAHAFTFSEMKQLEENIQNERRIRIENQLNWNLFKENLIRKDNDKIDSSLMTNLNTNLVQGAGLGTLVSLGTMIEMESKIEGDQYLISKDLMDLLLDNLKVTKKLIDVIQETEAAITHPLHKESVSIYEMLQWIEKIVLDQDDLRSINNHQVKVAENKFEKLNVKISLHRSSFEKVIHECLVNAMKFSEPNTNIYVFYELAKESFQISFLNSPEKNPEFANGIPVTYHRLIFEPFFRLSKFVFENYGTLDYGMGLCYSEKIIRNHGGKMSIANLKSHMEENQDTLIRLLIELPFAQ